MNILVSGSTGMVANGLIPQLTIGGHEVVRLVRSKARSPGKEMVHWDPDSGSCDPALFDNIDAVVHLAGEGIASGRWTAAKKQRIRDSRVVGTRLLCEAAARAVRKPKVLVCASAIGFYGDRGETVCTEETTPGSGFLPEVCAAWEQATEPARQAGIRVVNVRIGVVLSPTGGALAQMLLPFRLGVGGVLGSGRQYMSWIALDDLVAILVRALDDERLTGPVNGVSPQPVTNTEFTRTLGRVLWRPTLFPVPAFAARLLLGEMADALLLASTRVVPQKLNTLGFPFAYPTLEPALRHLLK